MVPAGAPANRPKVHHSWLTEETECNDYGILCVTRVGNYLPTCSNTINRNYIHTMDQFQRGKKAVRHNVMLAIAFL